MQWLFLVGLAVFIGQTCEADPYLFEEGSIIIHSKINISGCFSALERAKIVIEKLDQFSIEKDILTKVDAEIALAWEKHKISVISRLRTKAASVDVWAKSLHDLGANSNQGLEVTGTLRLKLDKHDGQAKKTNDLNDMTKNRIKRSINVLGNLLSYLTGVPGPDDWKLNTENIENLKKAIELVDQKVDLTDTRIDINQNEISKLNTHLASFISTLEHEVTENDYLKDGLRVRLLFASIEKDSLRILESVESMLYRLEMIMILGRHQFASKFGISPIFLADQLRNIETTSKILRPLFGVREIEMYYKNPFCTTTIVGNDLWVSLKIPLVNFSKMLKEVPKATYTTQLNMLTKLGESNPKLLKAEDGTYSIIGSAKERDCQKLSLYTLCEGKRVTMKAYHVNGSLLIKSFWSEISRNTLVFYDSSNLTVSITCLNKRYLLGLPLQGSLRLEQGCELVSDPVSVTEHLAWISEKTFVNPTFTLNEVDDRTIDRLTNNQFTNSSFYVHLEKKIHDISTNLDRMKTDHSTFTSKHDNIKTKLNSTSLDVNDRIDKIHFELGKRTLILGSSMSVTVLIIGILLCRLILGSKKISLSCINSKPISKNKVEGDEVEAPKHTEV